MRDIAELITRRRRQVLVHSVIYYRFNDNIISDATWSEWAQELENLQREYPEIAASCPLADAFKDFDHSSGCDLPLHDQWAINTAAWLLSLRDKSKKKSDKSRIKGEFYTTKIGV